MARFLLLLFTCRYAKRLFYPLIRDTVMGWNFKVIAATLAAAALLGTPFLQGAARAADPWPADSGTQIWSGNEPSGIVWHERLEKLFWVHDKGQVYQMDTDGTLDWSYYIGTPSDWDLEGIAIADPSSDNIYIGYEQGGGGVQIKEFDITTRSLTGNAWAFSEMNGHGNSGLEALTFVPNGAHPYHPDSTSGGLFYAGLQYDGKIYVYDVDLSNSGTCTHRGTITPVPGRGDLSGLHFHAETATLYAVFDNSNLIREMETDGTFIAEYILPGGTQEGVTLVPSYPSTTTEMYIAQDSGEIIEYGSYPLNWGDSDNDGLTNPEETETYGTDPYDSDTDSDGVSDYDEVWYDGDGGYDPFDPGSGTGTDTDANSADTDADGYSDCIEIGCGGNPISSGEMPAVVSINFQPTGSEVPAGYCLDSGVSYSPAGFGW